MTISSLGWGSGNSLYQNLRKTTEENTNTQLVVAAQMLQLANGNTTSSNNVSGSAGVQVSSSAQNSLYALLGSGVEMGGQTSPPGGADAAKFMDNLGSLLSALVSGDTNAATDAATALQTAIDNLTGTATSQTSETASKQDGPSGFLADVQNLLDAVQSGDGNAIESAVTTLADNLTRAAQSGPPAGPPPPPPAGSDAQKSVVDALDTLLSALASGDSGATNDAANSLQTALNDLSQGSDTNTTSDTGPGKFISDVQNLLDAVQSGDSNAISSAATALADGMNHHMHHGMHGGPPMGPPPPPPGDATASASGDKTTTETSLESAIATVSDLLSNTSENSSGTSSTQTAFLDSLKNLFEAMKTGNNVDDRLKAVITAYAENGTQVTA